MSKDDGLTSDDQVLVGSAAAPVDSISDEDQARLPPINDYFLWAYEQAAHIRAGRFDQVDVVNVADEIEDVGKREFEAVVSRLEQILLYMLKWDYQPSRRLPSWADAVAENRERLTDDLSDSPSLVMRLPDAIQRAYRYARHGASEDLLIAVDQLPETCPYGHRHITEAPYEADRE